MAEMALPAPRADRAPRQSRQSRLCGISHVSMITAAPSRAAGAGAEKAAGAGLAATGAGAGSSSSKSKRLTSFCGGGGGALAAGRDVRLVGADERDAVRSSSSPASYSSCSFADVSRKPLLRELLPVSTPDPRAAETSAAVQTMPHAPSCSLPKPPYRLPLAVVKLTSSLLMPPYLFLFALAFLRSWRTRSRSDNSSASSLDRFRTVAVSRAEASSRTVDALILALLVDVVKVAQDFDHRDVGARIVDNTLRAVLDEVLEQLERLVDLPPLPRFLLGEAFVDPSAVSLASSRRARTWA